MRSYLVYTLCSVPPLVNHSPTILGTCSSIPGLKELSEAVVRRTFFAQFVGGDSLPDTLPLISSLRQQNTGTLLVYSVEAEEGAPGAQWKKNVEEILASVNFAGDFEDTQAGGRKTWVAVKLTALLPSPDSLKRMSTFLLASRPKDNVSYPGTPGSTDLLVLQDSESTRSFNGLTEDDVKALRELYRDLREICVRAKERGVRITVDAEHTWYQPGIDAFVLALSREFNRTSKDSKIPAGQPLVYGTYQAYLRRTPAHIAHALEDSKKYKYALGVKLVRGAYHGQEIAYHQKRLAAAGSGSDVEDLPAVWLRKDETDRCFNDCARSLVGQVQSTFGSSTSKGTGVGLLFGTHNKESCQHVLNSMVALGLGQKDADGRVAIRAGVEDAICFGQLYGMRDDLTNWIANSIKSASPMAFKYLPYGALAEVMPYLSRSQLVNVGLGTCAISVAGLAGVAIYADAPEPSETRAPLGTLLRSYLVYSACSVPAFVNYSPILLEACASVPGLKQVSEAVVRRTFFAQFVGGDTCEDTLPLIAELRRQNKGTLLAYSVEVDEKNSASGAARWKKNVDEMRASVDFAGDFEDALGQKGPRKTWVAIKLSALVPAADPLKRMSAFLLKERPRDDVPYPGTPGSFDLIVFEGSKEVLLKGGLTEEDITSLRTLYGDLRRVCKRARERGIRLIFDAEHTWYQPGIDAFVLALSREFNQPPRIHRNDLPDEQPLVYGTYQAYLKR
ncbi:hypothetical protein FRC06_003989, partial [Ceratobasidium sp. 370]